MANKTVCIIFFLLFMISCSAVTAVSDQEDKLELKTYTVQYGDIVDLGRVMEDMKSPRGKVTVYEDANSIIVLDTPEVQARLAGLLNKLDVKRKQVMIDVLLTETTASVLERVGLVGNQKVFSPGKFNEVKYLLNNNIDTTIRSEMTLRTISGDPASLQISDEEIYPGGVYHNEDYAVVIPTRERQAGSFLEVLPRVSNAGTITVDITPTQSEFTGMNTTHARELSTRVIIEDGDTIVLGGLETSGQAASRSNIPLTGLDVAGSGQVNTKTVMFLTVNIDRG